MIAKLLIANRGEIACRIIRTARAMGIATVAVYSDADARALHVRQADEAVHIGPSPAAESYLVGEKIIAAAKQTGAEAIHPGYGFLSENAGFAQAVIDAGLTWVGPKPSSIEAMGLKDAAKTLMMEAGVPVTPGYLGADQSAERLKKEADAIGYPVLIKAVAGGGGKGMRKVDKAEDFEADLQSCRREAKASFSNDEVLLEKWITSPRHIEVQVFGDSHGNVVHLFERDCSLQRRHQKVIEEAPAPGMDEATRQEICAAAVRAAKAVDYEGAGTIEFIADASEGLRADRIFFMEMNTRLQVEHPVTEMITGLDLVEWQLRVASGEQLPATQDELSLTGHAVEARIYAEDPNSGFLPSTGKLVAMDLGEASDNVRVDSGVEQGDVISPHYDPMIAKLIFHGATRAEALAGLEVRLRQAQIAGPITNTAFLANLCADKSFQNGNFDTSLIDTKLDKLISTGSIGADTVCAGVCGLIERQRIRLAAENARDKPSPWQAADGFQLLGSRELDWQFTLDGERLSARVRFGPDGIEMADGNEGWTKQSTTATVYEDGSQLFVLDGGRQSVFEETLIQPGETDESGASDGRICVPMHGKIIAVTVQEGDPVEQGDLLFSVEAMKMEHAVLAPHDGVVEELAISAGEQVENGFPAMILVSENESN
ncbi:MAG: acetyl/propionyl/methylcrotonyl-CoA carboxylase subunit alpha [Qipengyuania citrea]